MSPSTTTGSSVRSVLVRFDIVIPLASVTRTPRVASDTRIIPQSLIVSTGILGKNMG